MHRRHGPVARTAALAALLSGATVLAQSTPRELNEAAWKALRNGNPTKATALFTEALSIRPNDPVLLYGLGVAAHEDGRERDAMARLQEALAGQPALTAASKLLGQIAAGQDDLTLAIQTYERARIHAPNDAELSAQLEAWRRETTLHRSFEERRYDRFKVMFEGRAEESLAAHATGVLKTQFREIGEKLGYYPTSPIVVVFYTEKQFRDITRAPEWADGLYDGRIRLPVQGALRNIETFDRVLTHELVHAMLANLAPHGIPTWLHEGLAQSFEGEDRAAARRRIVALGRSIPLVNLEGPFARLSAAQAQVAYDESLLAAGVLFDRPGFSWSRFTRELSSSDSVERTLKRFGIAYADLEAAFGVKRP